MDLAAFIVRARDHYVGQLEAFVAEQARSCARGAAEIKLQLHETSELFGQLYCIDFLKTAEDGRHELVELQPARILAFDPVSGALGRARLSIEHLRWDDVLIRHDAAALAADDLTAWFEQWFDPRGRRHVEGALLSECIHSLRVEPGVLGIDFGSAPPAAFLEILALLERAGASLVRVSSARAEAELAGRP